MGWSVVDPAAAAVLPALEFAGTEPQVDFLLGALHRVAAMDHVPVGGKQDQTDSESEPGTRNLADLCSELVGVLLEFMSLFKITTRVLIAGNYSV